jgi:hypothetical protein
MIVGLQLIKDKEEERVMNGYLSKGLLFGIIFLFIGSSILPMVNADENQKSLSKDINGPMGYKFYFVNVTIHFDYDSPVWSIGGSAIKNYK